MKKILIVEDSKFINNMVKKEFNKLAYISDQAFNFCDAEIFLSKTQYDLIILDLSLPDGEGYELIDKVNDITNTKIVILTSNTKKELREKLFHYGILDYIIKDHNLSYSINEIHKVLLHLNEQSNETILVIDDSDLICEQIKIILSPRNYNITITKNAKDGLDKLKNHNYDLIALDMELPDIHGLKVLDIIKSDNKYINIPVLITSAYSDPDIIRTTYKKGASDYIRKPFIMEEFVLKVDLWIDYRKKHIKELKQKDIQLSQQAKMVIMGEMLENIIHQSRQPLSTISAAASSMLIEQELNLLTPDYLTEKLEVIIDSAVNLGDTMGGFRNFYQTKTEKKEFKLSELILKTLNLIESKLKKNNINIETSFEDITFKGYEIELFQVFINILNNSIDTLENKSLKQRLVFIRTLINNNNIEIYIKDNAGGILNEILNKVFDSHFTTKETGVGIGLFMSQKIVQEHHDGIIEVKNQNFIYDEHDYTGAEFCITLPINTK
ncbi:MAG: response regulator [Campylobacterota bacterium]|nr:response regulator [Campylobacterota bacterium]